MRLTLARSVRSIAALVVALLVATGLSATPAAAAGSLSISGFVYLGSSATPATSGDAVVQFTKVGTAHNIADEVALSVDGSYSIAGLESGSYRLYVVYQGSAGYCDMYYNNVPPGAHPALVNTVNLYSVSATAINVTLQLPAAISGTVKLGPTLIVPAAGEVAVYYSKYIDGVSGPEEGPVLTDATGAFSFPSMPVGTYSFRFDYLGTDSYLDRDWSMGGNWGGGGAPILFRGGTAYTALNIVLPHTSTVTGTVRLIDSPELPAFTLAGDGAATVDLYAFNSSTSTMTFIASTSTNASGKYTFTGLSDRTAYKTITTLPSGEYGPVTSAAISGGGGGGTVSLYRNYTVTGRIDLGDDAHPAAAGDVTVTFAEAFDMNNRHMGTGGTTVTDSDGNYSISGLLGQYYTVTLTYNGTGDYLDSIPVLPIPWTGHNGVWMPTVAEHDINFVMPASSSITGAVTNTASAPVEGVNVYAVYLDPDTGNSLGEVTTTTDSQGHYAFAGLPEGLYVVQFEAAGYVPQSYPGVSYYYSPEPLYVVGGDGIENVDAVLLRPAVIEGYVNGTNFTAAQFVPPRTFVVLSVFNELKGEWRTVDAMYVSDGGGFTFYGLAPDSYRVRVVYSGPLGQAMVQSPVITLAERQRGFFTPYLKPVPANPDGSVLRGPSGSLYLTDSFQTLYKLRSLGAATDAGLSGSYRSVTQEFIDAFTIFEKPLSNVWRCSGVTYLAAEGKLWPIDEQLVAGLSRSDVNCYSVPKATTPITGPLFLTSPAGKTYLIGEDGLKRQVLTSASMNAIAAPGTARAYKVNDAFLNSLPTGLVILPEGSAVRAPSGRVYFVASSTHLVPVLSWDVPNSMGVPSVATTVTQADINQATVEPESAPLTSVLVCASTTYFAAEGKLWNVAASQVAGLPQTVLSPQACSVLPKSASSISGALFVQSTAGGPSYQIMADGAKREVTGRVALRPGTFALKVAPSFLSSRPLGPPIQPFSIPPRPVADFTAPAVASINTSAIPSDPRAACYSEFFAAVGASMYGQVATASDPQALLAECLA